MSNENVFESPSKIDQYDSSIMTSVSINYSNDETPSFIDDYSDTEDSSDGMEIVITDSPKRKKEIDLEDKMVLENIEEEIDKQLDEKAAKSNLTATNVKNILKHVISNEHVLAMVRHTVEEGDSTDEETFVYEPKLTRAKAKELYEQKNVINPWVKPLQKPESEVHILINADLAEESDDDEYVPNEYEESEDDKDSSRSDIDSQPSTPQTPSSQIDSATQTNWTDDGMFKIPLTPSVMSDSENIALRTRSKLSLSDTPLEKIEEAFIPPDITTDMYDLECDDEDWRDFLNRFTKPLEEAVQGQPEDDDEADPEYNVLADEDVRIVDHEELHEELREDKAVKVTKKELTDLVAELFDCSDLFLFDEPNILNDSILNETPAQVEEPSEPLNPVSNENIQEELETIAPFMTYEQKQLLDQQLRQHVQLTATHYLQSYKHPEYASMAKTFKDFLLALFELGKYKTVSTFHIVNLKPALEIIEYWEQKFENDDPDILEMKEFVQNEIIKSKRVYHKKREQKRDIYSVKHSPYFLRTVSNSCAFLYPELLPAMPFRCDLEFLKQTYVSSENKLIALGLEQFNSYVEEDRYHITKFGKIRLSDAAFLISKYVMPHKDSHKIYRHIKGMNEKGAPPNPIKFCIENNKAPPITQYVTTLESLGIMPPCKRPPEDLPHQWKMFNYPIRKQKSNELAVKSSVSRKSRSKRDGNTQLPQTQHLGDHLLVQDINCPDLYNLIPVVNNKVAIPKIDKSNKRKRKTVKPTEKESKKLKPNDSDANIDDNNKQLETVEVVEAVEVVEVVEAVEDNTTSTYVPRVTIKYEHCEDIDIDETDLSKIKLESLEENTVRVKSEKLCNIASIFEARIRELIKTVKIFLNKDFLSTPLKRFKFNSTIFQKLKKSAEHIFQTPLIKRVRNSDNMLPSMPFLLTPSKSLAQEEGSPEKEKDTENEKNIEPEANDVNDSPEEVKNDKKDNEDELNALMVASSTIQKSKKLLPSSTEKRKLKIQREYNATLSMLLPENPNIEEDKANNFAQAYFDKVHERLETENPCTYQKFMEVLSDYDPTKPITELWENIETILSNHPDLCEEFLTFLTPEQAKLIGKLVPHFLMANMSLFLRKLEIYFNNQPAQLRKIYNSLTELANMPDIKMEQVKGIILPLLKGNGLLIDWFLQMFPSEKPPESLMNVWENVQCDEENFDSDNEPFETITLPETEDPYGGPNCICHCHKNDDEMYASRARHCIPCGTKFLQGRVYVQTGKGLRLANVTFNNTPNTDHNKRLSAKPTLRQKRKSETSPSKTPISPTKEDEPRHSNESEDDINLDSSKNSKKTFKNASPKARKRNRPTPRNRKIKTPKENITRRIIKPKVKKNDQNEPAIDQIKETELTESEITKTETAESETEIIEWDLKSPERSVESADTCEESSQDTVEEQNSDSDISIAEIESVSENSEDELPSDCLPESNDGSSWTRTEDKVILQMFKEYGDGEHIYKNIQQVLSNRTVAEIRQRFRLLLSLLQEMSHV